MDDKFLNALFKRKYLFAHLYEQRGECFQQAMVTNHI